MTVPGSGIAALPAHLRRRLANAFDTGLLPEAPTQVALEAVLGPSVDATGSLAELEALAGIGIRGRAVAAWLQTVDEASNQAPAVDLVWSGPEVPGLHSRDTRRVFEELVRSAQRSLWISTFAYFDGRSAFGELAQRLDAIEGLRARLLLNIQRSKGDTTDPEQLVRRFADRFWGTDWPGKSRPAVYYDRRSLDPAGPAGVLHAKALVADDESVFITSANLTEAAFDRNIELGLLTRNHVLAASITTHFQGLIDTERLSPLPSV